MIVERSISIARSSKDVFDFVSDIRNEPGWHTDVLEARLTTDGPVGRGSTFEVKLKPSMGVSGGTMTVAEYEPGRQVVFNGQIGKMRPIVTHACTPEGTGTHFVRRVEIDPPGLMKLMGPMMKSMIGKSNTGFVANLKRVLEASA